MPSLKWTSPVLKGTPDFSWFRARDERSMTILWTCDKCAREIGANRYPRDNNLPVTCPGCGDSVTFIAEFMP